MFASESPVPYIPKHHITKGITMDMLTDLGRFTPVVDEFGLENLFSSNPNYDEVRGPPRDCDFIPIEGFAEEDWSEADEEEYFDRIFFQDPTEPLGPGETEASVREDAKGTYLLITVDPDHQVDLGPVCNNVRWFSDAEVLPAKNGFVTVAIKKFDRNVKRWLRINSTVSVTVRRARQ